MKIENTVFEANASSHSLVAIDSQVTDWQSLIADINPDTSILVLDSARDGLTQIAEAVAKEKPIDALHIISHGTIGSLQLGASTLSSDNLNTYHDQLSTISNALTDNGDILLYGCEVAQGEVGQSFIEQFARLTGADVAASTTLMGNADLGGDWVLDAQKGSIEASSAISAAAQSAYQGTLSSASALVSNYDPVNGYELWVTDGTKAGTHLVKDIVAGTGSSNPGNFQDLGNGKVLFNASTYTYNLATTPPTVTIAYAEWVTDGTAAGTVQLATTNGNASSYQLLGNGKALFSSYNPATSTYTEWVTDGTAAGTAQLATTNGGASSYQLLGNGKTLFSTYNAVTKTSTEWITDGTAAGTAMLTGISYASNFQLLGNGNAVFSSYNSATSTSTEWVTDGTAAGTTVLSSVSPISPILISYNSVVLGNGKMLFDGTDATHGPELWVTDGTAAGTTLLKDIVTGGLGSLPLEFASLGNGKALFAAFDATNSSGLWVTDGTATGTTFVLAANVGGVQSFSNGKALFGTVDNVTNTYAEWITDGTVAGTAQLATTNGDASSTNQLLGNGKALFTVYNSATSTYAEWVTDGTAAGTAQFATTNGYVSSYQLLGNGKTLFTVQNGGISTSEWVTDGTAAGTAMLTGISNASSLLLLGNGNAVFSSFNSATSITTEWVTDGTAAGTTALSVLPTSLSSYNSVVLGNGKMLFKGTDATHGSELWVTDGTAAGTTLLKDIDAGTISSNPINFTSLGNGTATFNAYTSYGPELWVTDGTAAGTFSLVNHAPTLSAPATVNYIDTQYVDTFATATGTLQGSDVDAGTVLTYGITGGTDNGTTVSATDAYGTLTVTKATGAYSFVANSAAIEPLSANVTDSTLTVTVSDGTINANQAFTVNITQNGITETNGNDTFYGTAGADHWAGLQGNDTYYVNNVGDTITELPNQGWDTVYSSISYTLPVNVEALVLQESAGNANATGNNAYNYLVGNSGNNVLSDGGAANQMAGGAGNDTYNVSNAGDVIVENANAGWDMVWSSVSYTLPTNVEALYLYDSAGNANATGNTGNTYLVGNSHNNILSDGGGAATMSGGAGNDSYYVNNSADVITETANQGTDSVYASISYTLSANVENLILTGTAAINATGNGAGNVLTGNSADNIISDGGSAGVATMAGGAGNDTYYVNNSADVITENANAGWDTVYSSTSYTLPVNVEAVVLQESAGNATIKGNNAYNYLVGNSSDNILVDGSATNQMAGGAGNDTYSVSHSGDVIVENTNAGWDTVWSSVNYTLPTNVEELLLYKGAGNINGYGNSSANYMVGNDGNNLLDAQAGNDTLVAGSGNDTLVGGLGQDYYDLSGAAAISSDTIRIATGDSTVGFGNYDYAVGFKLGTGTSSTTGVDQLDLVSTTIAANAAAVDGTNAGAIMSHSITNGIISFATSDSYASAPLTLSDGYLGDVFSYLQANITGNQTVGFVCSGNTYVFQDAGAVDTLVELVGVTATSLSNTGLAANSVWIV